ncbi:MAG TPA: helix-turn-helix domain-containing protein [Candidatus Cybelea sp.]|nr:helix-turn-helix domain-containing protein [Candidatus Cybelea sp.]
MSVIQKTAAVEARNQSAPSRAPWPVLQGGRSSAADETMRVLQSIGSTLSFRRNSAVFNEGDPSKHVYKVVSGAIRTCRVLMDGRRQIADFYLPGDFFGLDWESEHTFTAEAVADAVVISYPKSQLEQLGETTPAIRKLLMAMLCKGLSATQNHIVMLGRQTAHERLAWFLLRSMKRNGLERGALDLPMSRLDIADYLGLTIETVSRGISEFKRRRYISIANAHQISVTNAEALESLASGETED